MSLQFVSLLTFSFLLLLTVKLCDELKGNRHGLELCARLDNSNRTDFAVIHITLTHIVTFSVVIFCPAPNVKACDKKKWFTN